MASGRADKEPISAAINLRRDVDVFIPCVSLQFTSFRLHKKQTRYHSRPVLHQLIFNRRT